MSPTTLLNTVSLSELTDLIRKEFASVQNMVKPQAGQIYIADPIAKGNGSTKRYDEIDTQTFARRKRQGESSKKAAVGVGYNVTAEKKRIALEIDITQEMRDENRYAEVGSLITSLTHFCPQRIELDQTHLLTFCSAVTYTDMDGDVNNIAVGDGLALASTAHTLKFSSTTYSNRVSGDPIFSRGALEAAEALATTNVLSNFGERRVMSFNTIITTDDPNTCNSVKQFLESTSDVDAAQSGVMNVYKGKYRHIALPYLATTATGARDSTKERIWFLASIGQGTNGWQAYYSVWEAPHMKDMSTDDRGANHDYSRDIWTFGTRAGYSVRAVTGRGLIASLPTS
jgi:hypothetical protein